MRICIVADNASMRFGGEAVLPLHYFRLLRQRGVDASLIVHERVRAELEALLPEERGRIVFVCDTVLQKAFYFLSSLLPRRIGESTLGLLSLLLTQFQERRAVRTLMRAGRVDLVHQPTPVAARCPSLFHSLGIPVVIGPMNGNMEYPAAFRSHDSMLSRALIPASQRLSGLANRLIPGKRRASVLLVANERTRAALPRQVRDAALLLVENGVELTTWQPAAAPPPSAAAAPRFVFIGRLVPFKALDIALHALTAVPGAQLDIIGDGPMLASWRQLAQDLGLGAQVRFLGWLSQAECAGHLRSATALLLPSLYECGGAVVLEAMAMARPVIATAWGGPADYLDDSCGVLVPPHSGAALIAGFAAGMRRFAADPLLAHRMGAAARRRAVDQFSWDAKIDRILEIYAGALASHAVGRRGAAAAAQIRIGDALAAE